MIHEAAAKAGLDRLLRPKERVSIHPGYVPGRSRTQYSAWSLRINNWSPTIAGVALKRSDAEPSRLIANSWYLG